MAELTIGAQAATFRDSATARQSHDNTPFEIPLGFDSVGFDSVGNVTPGSWLTPKRVVQATWAFVALGLLARVVRYLLCFPLWGDEAFVAASFIDRGFSDLVSKPLAYHQVCPPLFLWIELGVVKVLGFNEYALRLLPCVASLASVLVFRHMCARLLRGIPLLISVAIFCVAYYPIRHGAEVKPYACDLLVSVVLLAMAVEWWREPARSRWLWAMAAVGPLAIGLSHPACFVAGGISIGLALAVWRSGRLPVRLAFAAFNLSVVGAFVANFLLFTHRQAAAESYMWELWSHTFPPMARPWQLPGWLLEAHTGHTFAYPVGGKNGGSTLTFICFAIAAVWLSRRSQKAVVACCLAPFGLHFVAAALQRYPYGGSTRFMLDLAPAICLLTGVGATLLIARLPQVRFRRAGLGTVIASLLVLGLVGIARDVQHPYKHAHELRYRDFARWFWYDKAQDAELVCVQSDLGRSFSSRNLEWGWSALYLCNQKIYSARHAMGRQAQFDSVSGGRPLRCVLFSASNCGRDETALSKWLAEMERRYGWVAYEKHDFHGAEKTEAQEWERVELFEFVPRSELAHRSIDLASRRVPPLLR